MTEELYVACPLCGIPNFTKRGLRAHRCDQNKRDGVALPLSKEDWEKAIAGARAAATALEKANPKFELLPAQDAATEKEIGLNVKTMEMGLAGADRSEALHYAYAAITGAAANRLADLVPARGGLEKLLEQKFPKISRTRLAVWRTFARDLVPHLAINPAAGFINLITAPVIGKKPIPMKRLEGFQEAVKKVLKGHSMADFHKASSFAGEVEEQGGYQYGKKKLEAWLKEHHPDLLTEGHPPSYEELPPKIQAAFRKFNVPAKITAEEQAEMNRDEVRALWHRADEVLNEKLYADLDDLKELEDMDGTWLSLHNTFKQIIAKRKAKG